VKRALGGYVDFAVFQAGSLLPSSMAAGLPAVVASLLEALGGAGASSSRMPSALATG
jgi:hypothetical protein